MSYCDECQRTAELELDPVGLLTPADVARELRIGRTKTYELLASGAIACTKVGARIRVTPEALAAYMNPARAEVAPTVARLVRTLEVVDHAVKLVSNQMLALVSSADALRMAIAEMEQGTLEGSK